MRKTPALAALALAALLAGCGSTPTRIDNLCAVFDQRDGFFNDWYAEAKKAESRHGIPVHVLMATVRVESGFDGKARPPRRKVLGMIPWKRASSAFGYSQALKGTWDEYRRETGNTLARRDDFGDATDFIGWYYAKTVNRYGVPRDDAYSLYISYENGWGAFGRGTWRTSNPNSEKHASRAAMFARTFEAQLSGCD